MKKKKIKSKNGLERAAVTAKVVVLKKEAEPLIRRFYEIQKEIHDLTRIGYRAICMGDEYDYGGYSDYLFKDYGQEESLKRATECVEKSKNGGHVDDIYIDTPKPGRIH